MVVWQEPEHLNWELGSQTIINEVASFAVEGLARVNDKGQWVPVLAVEVPTQQNGGVSADGKVVTYKLKQNVKWHDGTDFTCEDLQFTWKVIMTPNNGAIHASQFKAVDAIECPDPHTAVIKFKEPYASYIRLFSGIGHIFPRNAGKPEELKTWMYNRKPIGTGPFKVDEFVTGDHITLSRNENYHVAGKPYLDQVIIRIVRSTEVAKQLLKTGEADVMWNNAESDVIEISKMPGVKLSSASSSGGERLILNLVKPGDPADNKTPHPILGDLRVRQAIAYGIDKKTIVDQLLNGLAQVGTSDLNVEPYNCGIAPWPYDPAKAKQLLDEAGWKVGADGIRVKDGQRLRLKYQTTTGSKLREDMQVLIVENMKAIGIEFYIENQSPDLLIGSWAAGSPRKRGSFDIIMYSTSPAIDPHSMLSNYFASTSIPSATNQGGLNVSRWNDPETDRLLQEAGSIFDWGKRKELYCQVARRVVEGASHIYLYQSLNLNTFRDRVQGWIPNSWGGPGWNAADWWVK